MSKVEWTHEWNYDKKNNDFNLERGLGHLRGKIRNQNAKTICFVFTMPPYRHMKVYPKLMSSKPILVTSHKVLLPTRKACFPSSRIVIPRTYLAKAYSCLQFCFIFYQNLFSGTPRCLQITHGQRPTGPFTHHSSARLSP